MENLNIILRDSDHAGLNKRRTFKGFTGTINIENKQDVR